MAGALQFGVRLSQTSPAFLHSNSTSHTWPFSAVAELIDNAYDPDVKASQLFIDVEHRLQTTCLTFTDNGNGLTPDRLHKMLSFGYCEKVEVNGHKPVGHYGNGFKSGSMRLARDALVFTKCTQSMSVGFLSQTYLRNINATTVLVPMVTWNLQTKKIMKEDSTGGSMEAICSHSLFKSEKELHDEFKELSLFRTGTRIVLYNLKRGNEDRFELDFESNSKDIINPESQELDITNLRPVMEHVPEYIRSLREYCSILFLKPRMKIVLRSHKVKTKLISKSLSSTETDYYKPVYLTKPIKIILGFNSSQMDYGLMMYHKNRLIKAYEHVGCQKQANDHGVGVVGVVELDILEPVHNKQDFNKTDRYNACINALGNKLNDYWYTKAQNTDGRPQDETPKADWTWVQCDNCLKWRRLPDRFSEENDLPDKWFCYMNVDPTHNRCEVDEEPEDEDELQNKASYNKMKKKVEPRKSGEIIRREQALAEKERELQEIQQSIQSLEPLAKSGSKSNRPTMADFEKATQELEEARRREREQSTMIQKLTEQHKQQMFNGQNQMRQTMSSNISTLSCIGKTGGMTNVGRNGGAFPTVKVKNGISHSVGATALAKHKAPVSKERIHLPGGDAVIVTRNETSSDTDSVQRSPAPRKRKKLLVRFPHRKRQREERHSDVIVIDSDVEYDSASSSSTSSPDVKPDVNELESAVRETEKSSKNDRAKSSNTPKKSTKTCGMQTDAVESSSSARVQDHDDSKQTLDLLQLKLEKTQSQLSSLRNNVGKLLQTILPELQVDQVEYIDAIVKEMVRVNTKKSS